jgi:hypothetical protein
MNARLSPGVANSGAVSTPGRPPAMHGARASSTDGDWGARSQGRILDMPGAGSLCVLVLVARN